MLFKGSLSSPSFCSEGNLKLGPRVMYVSYEKYAFSTPGPVCFRSRSKDCTVRSFKKVFKVLQSPALARWTLLKKSGWRTTRGFLMRIDFGRLTIERHLECM